jgi:hypothetical protein
MSRVVCVLNQWLLRMGQTCERVYLQVRMVSVHVRFGDSTTTLCGPRLPIRATLHLQYGVPALACGGGTVALTAIFERGGAGVDNLCVAEMAHRGCRSIRDISLPPYNYQLSNNDYSYLGKALFGPGHGGGGDGRTYDTR